MILDVLRSQERAQLDGLNQFDGALTRLWDVRSGKCFDQDGNCEGEGRCYVGRG